MPDVKEGEHLAASLPHPGEAASAISFGGRTMKYRSTVSMNPRTTLLLQRLSSRRNAPCAALVQRLIEETANLEGVTVSDADVEAFKRLKERRAAPIEEWSKDGASKMGRIREAGA